MNWIRVLEGLDGDDDDGGLLVSMASKRYVRCFCSLMYVSISKEYVSEWMFSIMIWKP